MVKSKTPFFIPETEKKIGEKNDKMKSVDNSIIKNQQKTKDMVKTPHLNYEKQLWQKGYLVIGVDEVGRGALAGPVFASACLFLPDENLFEKASQQKIKIADSKKLTAPQRLTAYQWIKNNCLSWAVSKIGVEKINKFGIGKSSIIAMHQAIKQLVAKIRKRLNGQFKLSVLSDYFYITKLENLGINYHKPITHGDEISFSIASASIIAKVERDKLMTKLAKHYSFYQWEKNKGYGTLTHRAAIKKYGISKHHRFNFVSNIPKK